MVSWFVASTGLPRKDSIENVRATGRDPVCQLRCGRREPLVIVEISPGEACSPDPSQAEDAGRPLVSLGAEVTSEEACSPDPPQAVRSNPTSGVGSRGAGSPSSALRSSSHSCFPPRPPSPSSLAAVSRSSSSERREGTREELRKKGGAGGYCNTARDLQEHRRWKVSLSASDVLGRGPEGRHHDGDYRGNAPPRVRASGRRIPLDNLRTPLKLARAAAMHLFRPCQRRAGPSGGWSGGG